jgi:glycerophosphoryl diester phosphodiesterase
MLESLLPGSLSLILCASPLVVAHRGYSAVAPENTLAAFRAAIEAGAPAAECDVYCTRDGHVVLMHDGAVDRTTDGTGPLTEMTLEQVKALDAGSWKGEAYRGERVPTLAEALALTKGHLRLVVEVKQAGIEEAVVAAIREAEAIPEVTIISFSAATCARMRELEPELPVGWLTGGVKEDDPEAADTLLRTALRANCQFLDVAHPGITPALVRRADLAGMAVWAWTVDDPARARELAALGVRSITTNDPGRLLKAFGEGRPQG